MRDISDIENLPKTQTDTHLAKAKPVKLGWTTQETARIAEVLNQLLSNLSIHYQKLRNYHWNVKGQDFFDLHLEFEAQYEQAGRSIDQVAERLRVFGVTPLSKLQDYLKTADIKETGTDLSAEVMVRELLGDYRILLDNLSDVVDVAIAQSDYGSEELAKKLIYKIEKHHWMLSAFLAK